MLRVSIFIISVCLILPLSTAKFYANNYDFDLRYFNKYVEILKLNWTAKYHSINESRVHFIFKKNGSKEEVAVSIYDLGSNENAITEWERKLSTHLSLEAQPDNKYKVIMNRKENYFETKGPEHNGRFYVNGQFFTLIHVSNPSFSYALQQFYSLYESTFNE